MTCSAGALTPPPSVCPSWGFPSILFNTVPFRGSSSREMGPTMSFECCCWQNRFTSSVTSPVGAIICSTLEHVRLKFGVVVLNLSNGLPDARLKHQVVLKNLHHRGYVLAPFVCLFVRQHYVKKINYDKTWWKDGTGATSLTLQYQMFVLFFNLFTYFPANNSWILI